jgi:hypothetical protein
MQLGSFGTFSSSLCAKVVKVFFNLIGTNCTPKSCNHIAPKPETVIKDNLVLYLQLKASSDF